MPTNETISRLLDEELASKIQQAIRYFIIPCISIVGIFGNTASILILSRRGFRKCSKILLTALSVSDVFYLAGINNICGYMYFQNVATSFRLSETINYVHYILYLTFLFFSSTGCLSALVIPALITGERILAINFPLIVNLILTPRRTVCIIYGVYIVNSLYFVYKRILRFDFTRIAVKNATLDGFGYIDVRLISSSGELFAVIGSIVNYMTGIVPICLVSVGCAVIGIQITLIAKRRKLLTSGQAQLGKKRLSLKTTKTLLSICLLYVVCSGYSFAIGYVKSIKHISRNMPLKNMLLAVEDFTFCINSVGDFVIYVGANGRFRKLWTKSG